MRFDLSSQNTKLLQEQKKHRQWLIVFLCLAAAVVFSTIAALKLYGQALTHKVKVLDCQAKVHEHEEACYVYDEEKEEDTLICGYADYLIHIHNDDCYDDSDRLVCPLPERKPHTHEESCYEERKVLICGMKGAEPETTGTSESRSGQDGLIQGTEGADHETVDIRESAAEQKPVEEQLSCTEEEHIHTDECYKSELSCEQEEHRHGDNCYDSELTCETEEHEHDDGCLDENGDVVCETEEHKHGDDCYTKTLICEIKEHEHDESCYSSKVLICGNEEHEHTDICYTQVKTADVQTKESKATGTTEAKSTAAAVKESQTTVNGKEGTHVHTAACYETKKVLVCGQQEKHVHDKKCYDKEGSLICGLLQLEEHVHNKDCFKKVELTDEEVAALNAGAKLHIHHEDCYDEEGGLICGHETTHIHGLDCYNEKGELICGYEVVVHVHDENCYDEEGKLVCDHAHIHEESCFDEDGEMTCDFEDVGDYRWICEKEDYIVTVRFTQEAEIPVNARLNAEQITADGDEAYFAQRENEYKEAMEDEDAAMRALLRIGFYVENKDAKEDEDRKIEIEPKAPVTVTVRFLDEDGLAEGNPITVVHFAEEGTELLDGGQAEDNSTTFELNSFSEIAIGYGDEGAKAARSEGETDGSVSGNSVSGNSVSGNSVSGNTVVRLDDSFTYEDEAFHITFHVEGNVILPQYFVAKNQEDTDGTGEMNEAFAFDKVDEPEGGKNGGKAESEEAGEKTETEGKAENGETSEITKDGETEKEIDQEKTPADQNIAEKNLDFKVEILDGESDAYVTAVNSYLEESAADELLWLQVLSYSLAYDEAKLDLSDCAVTAEITPTQELITYAEDFSGISTMEADEENRGFDQSSEEKVILTALGLSEEENAGTVFDTMEVKESEKMSFTMNPKGTDGTVAVAAGTGVNPSFTVQYYANIKVVDAEVKETETIKKINMIDTSGKKLPTNDSTLKTKPIYVNKESGEIYYKEELSEIYKSEKYKFFDIAVEGIGDVKDFNIPTMNDHYRLAEIYVINDPNYRTLVCTNGDSAHVHNEKDCYRYPHGIYNSDQYTKYIDDLIEQEDSTVKKYEYKENRTKITNNPESANGNQDIILIDEGTVIRLIYDTVNDDKETMIDAAFYDYDVSDGKVYTRPDRNSEQMDRNNEPSDDNLWYLYTNKQGIHTPNNYNSSFGKKLAFGNQNLAAGTVLNDADEKGLSETYERAKNEYSLCNQKLDDFYINRGNVNVFQKCSFGLVTGLKDGKLVYNNGVSAPRLFNEGDAVGKTEYTDYPLCFIRDGDTYTLTAVKGTDTNNLHKLAYNREGWVQEGPKPLIWSNEFWPMDRVLSAGTDGHDPKVGHGSGESGSVVIETFDSIREHVLDENGKYKFLGGIPQTDYPGSSHNFYFGMTYDIEFNLDGYVGPLEYYFFGDDDMWVFLDGKLVCDLGGVHPATGEYVNLWEYLEDAEDHVHTEKCKKDLICKEEHEHVEACYEYTCSAVKHRLTAFYLERGGCGSCCWMRFTLPNVTPAPPAPVTGSLQVEKAVVGSEAPEGLKYEFSISLMGEEDALINRYPYTKYDKDGKVVKADGAIADGGTFTLGDGEKILINCLPIGTAYEVTETGKVFDQDDKEVTGKARLDYDIVDGKIKTGDISSSSATVRYTNDYGYLLPETGGPGPKLYTMAGAICVIFGAGLLYRKKYRGRRV